MTQGLDPKRLKYVCPIDTCIFAQFEFFGRICRRTFPVVIFSIIICGIVLSYSISTRPIKIAGRKMFFYSRSFFAKNGDGASIICDTSTSINDRTLLA